MTVATISIEELSAKCADDDNIVVIDVRTPAEFRSGHAPFARSQPLDKLDLAQIQATVAPTGNNPLYVICKSGARATKACEKLQAAGCKDVVCVQGGTDAWIAAGLPVQKVGKQVMSLERQVRIAAGLLVFTGTLLAWLVSPNWLILPGFVGVGLTFAGITDFCGMGMLLGRCPWNR